MDEQPKQEQTPREILADKLKEGLREGLEVDDVLDDFDFDEFSTEDQPAPPVSSSVPSPPPSPELAKVQAELEHYRAEAKQARAQRAVERASKKYPEANKDELQRLADKGAPESVIFREAKRDQAALARALKIVEDKIPTVLEKITAEQQEAWGKPTSGAPAPDSVISSVDEWKLRPDRYEKDVVDKLIQGQPEDPGYMGKKPKK